MKLAVYGTLRSFHGANRLMKGASLVKEAVIPGVSLYNLGWFPGIKRNGGPGVTTEVYEVNEEILQRLDRYEGYSPIDPDGSLFVRTLTRVDGIDEPVFIYEYNHPVKPDRLVANGDWATVSNGNNAG